MANNPFNSSDIKDIPNLHDSAQGGVGEQYWAGLKESVPFYGERLAANEPKPTTLAERTARRAGTLTPYAAGTALLTGGTAAIPEALSVLGGGTLGGQIPEELGLGKGWQAAGEIAGGGIANAARNIVGKVTGYAEPQLTQLTSKAKSAGYEVGPGAKSSTGMKYGAGETEEAAISNLNKFTKEATSRTGYEIKPNQNMERWVKDTGNNLIKDVDKIFAGKKFESTPEFKNQIENLESQAQGAFGEQGNVVKDILSRNISGYRPGGSFTENTFNATDLRKAIVDINSRLSSATNQTQVQLLNGLKDSLDKLATDNLGRFGGNRLVNDYNTWKSRYNSFATIRDTNALAGTSGTTAASQINPKVLLDEMTRRTGGYPINNPLYNNLGEFGRILEAKAQPKKGFFSGATDIIPESTLGKALLTGLQPRALSRTQRALKEAQTYGAPVATSLQMTPEDIKNTQYLSSDDIKDIPRLTK